jgi:zinc transport system ATP-binding protein
MDNAALAAPSSSPLIRMEKVFLQRQGKEILQDISLSVNENDFLTIIGPNGAGKTSLLKLMLGIVAPDRGHIKRSANLRMGYVPQRLAVDATFPLTVENFLKLMHGTHRDERAAALEETRSLHLLKQPLYRLSGGELQRVLLARALLRQPHLLMLDEAAQNLDIQGQQMFYQLLEEIYRKRRCAVVMVSHDLHLVMRSSSQVVCLFHHICCSGKPENVAQAPEFRDLFGEDIPRVLALYAHHHGHSHHLEPTLHSHEEGCSHDTV